MVIACIISFIIGATIMLCVMGVVSNCKIEKPHNNVHFYVTKDFIGIYLWLGKPIYKDGIWRENPISCHFLGRTDTFYYKFNLYPKDFYDMKPGEIREVFLNLKDYELLKYPNPPQQMNRNIINVTNEKKS